jgi:hypothetical protein
MSAAIAQTSGLSQVGAAAEAAPDIVLQPGAVIDARVLAVRENLARILIAGLSLEVLTEVALQPGTNLKLAVSQTAEGTVRLAVINQDAAASGQAVATPSRSGPAAAPTSLTAPGVGAAAQAALPRVAAASLVPATPEALAVSQAVQTSAPRQASLAPLFANLPVIVASNGVPQQVQNAASQLLATRPPLDTALSAGDLRQAFQKSGLFLEATLARGAAPTGAPDLKEALVVFKQVLTSWLGQAGSVAQSPPATPQVVSPPATGTSQPLPQAGQTLMPTANGAHPPPSAPALVPGVERATAAQLRPQLVADAVEAAADVPMRGPSSVPPQADAHELPTPSSEILRAAAQAPTRDATAVLRGPEGRIADEPMPRSSAHPAGQTIAARQPADPAPPFRGAAPSPQPIAMPSLAPDTAPASMGQQLLAQTDAALARQTLLQVASLPDRPELAGTNQNTQPRWSFEIPFATPQGTAVAQFEIERDGGNEVEAAAPSRIWRARFTLDIESTGPVHALVSLIGDKTAVRMWAERPETAAQLRANADALSQALRQAELEPGDILVGEGAPPQPKPRAGRFLDRAT